MALTAALCRDRKSSGFTLMEILIVAAVIAIMAGIAIFNIQEFYQSSVRKGTIGESSQIGTAVSMARDDLGFFPKLNYLVLPASLITRASNGLLRADFDYMGFFNSISGGNPNNAAPPDLNAHWISERWQTMGYAAMSQARNRISQGRGGIVRVRLPSGKGGKTSDNRDIGQDALSDSLVDWPADPWGNPYVLYLLRVEKKPAAGTPAWRFVTSLNEPPDFAVSVVSYGPNGVPGSTWEAKPGNPWGANQGRPLNVVTPQQRDARLFKDGDDYAGPAKFTMPLPTGYWYDNPSSDQAAYLARLRTKIISGQWLSDFPPPTVDLAVGSGQIEIRGILDNGSDDIVFKF